MLIIHRQFVYSLFFYFFIVFNQTFKSVIKFPYALYCFNGIIKELCIHSFPTKRINWQIIRNISHNYGILQLIYINGDFKWCCCATKCIITIISIQFYCSTKLKLEFLTFSLCYYIKFNVFIY